MGGFIEYKNITCAGDIAYRSNANFTRLEGKKWRADTISTGDTGGWPGDWEGRTILALVLLSQSTHRKASFLDEIIIKLPHLLNEKHYFGKLLDPSCVDEQQLSGNSWFLRSMCEYQTWKKDEFSLQIIRDMVEHLILPCKGKYAEYPFYSSVRQRTGDMAGTLFDGIDDEWKLSSDNGCAFIMIDGASHAYQILKDPSLKEVLDEMIAKFLSADLLKNEFQTHATLSATRGMLRLYDVSKEEYLLNNAIDIFDLYKEHGMTENYANYNWFGRPDTWTEPCAIVDSLIVAMNLWKITKNDIYLQDANNIYYNAMGHAQRPNGGFGCDQCSAVADVFLQSHVDAAMDAYWCCSMRAGEGLSRVVSSSAYQEDDTIYFPIYNTAEMKFNIGEKVLILSEKSDFLHEGKTRFIVASNEYNKTLKLRFFVPEWTELVDIKILFNGNSIKETIGKGFLEVDAVFKKGDSIEIEFPVLLRKIPVKTGGKFKNAITLRHGMIILGVQNDSGKIYSARDILKNLDYLGNGIYQNRELDIKLEPINDLITMSTDEVRKSKKQILFS